MKVVFTDSFFKSLKKLKRQETWWYKTYDTIRYDIWYFFRNIWVFRKELYKFRWWDYRFNLDLFAKSLEITANSIEKNGIEVDESRLKKIAMMRRAIQLIKDREDHVFDTVEKEMGPLKNDQFFEREDTPEEFEHNRKFFSRVREIENQEWDELWTIIKGTGDYNDGSDIRRWWD